MKLPTPIPGTLFIVIAILFFFSSLNGQTPAPRAKMLWAYEFSDYGLARSEAIDADGNIYVVGQSTGKWVMQNGDDITFNGGDTDAILIKFSQLGTMLWGTYIGGDNAEQCRAVTIDKDGNIIVGGVTKSASGIATDGSTRKGMFLAKYSKTGQKLWGTNYGGSTGIDWISGVNSDWIESVITDKNGTIYISGHAVSTDLPKTIPAFSFAGYNDAFLAKFSSAGVLEWSRYFGGEVGESGNTLAIDNQNHIWMGGYTTSPDHIELNGFDNPGPDYNTCGFLAEFTATGEQVWGTYYGDNHYLWNYTEFTDIAFDSQGNLIATGFTTATDYIAYQGNDTTLAGYYDMFVLKMDNTKNKVWATYLGGENEEQAFGLALDSYDNIFITGYANSDSLGFAGFGDEFPGNGFQPINLTAKFSSRGDLMWSSYYNTQISGYKHGKTILSSGGKLFVAMESFMAIEDLDPANITATENEIQFQKSVVYPNPSSGKLKVANASDLLSGIEIRDVTGKQIFYQEVNNTNRSEEISVNTQPGMYLVILHYAGRKEIVKWIRN